MHMCIGTVRCLPDRGSYTCISIMIMDKKCYCIYVDVFLRVGVHRVSLRWDVRAGWVGVHEWGGII